MQKYYDCNGVTLYLGDCRELNVSHDLLVTDPPYGQKFESGKAGGKWGAIVGDEDLDGVHERLLHVLKGLREARHCYIFGPSLDATKLPLAGVCQLIWDKGMVGMGNLTLPWGPQHEQITFGVITRSKANRGKGYGALSARMRKGSVIRSLRANSRGVKHHPTEKPVDVLRQLIESSSMLGEVVYDPFSGSGSTLIAAALEGRVAVGCEIEERYCETTVKRLEAELPLF